MCLMRDIFTCVSSVIRRGPSGWVSLQVVLQCCVWLLPWTLIKDLGMYLVVLLKDHGNASQYRDWDIPGGSRATLLQQWLVPHIILSARDIWSLFSILLLSSKCTHPVHPPFLLLYYTYFKQQNVVRHKCVWSKNPGCLWWWRPVQMWSVTRCWPGADPVREPTEVWAPQWWAAGHGWVCTEMRKKRISSSLEQLIFNVIH